MVIFAEIYFCVQMSICLRREWHLALLWIAEFLSHERPNVTFREKQGKKVSKAEKQRHRSQAQKSTSQQTAAFQIKKINFSEVQCPETRMSEEWCIEQLAKLQIKERRLTTLNEIKTHLSTVSPNEINISTKFLTLLDSIDECRGR